MIDGVEIHPLRIIGDSRGEVRHMLRRDDPWFTRFGEIYFSLVRPNVVKAWHLHKEMTLAYACVYGAIRLELYDGRKESSTYGKHSSVHIADFSPIYSLVIIPPGIWNGFKSLSATEHAIIANCADMPHDPDEIERLPIEVPESGRAGYDRDWWRMEVHWGHYEESG